MSDTNVVVFPLSRVEKGTRYFWYFVKGISQFNSGGQFAFKTTSKKKLIEYLKPHDSLGNGVIYQLKTDTFQFLPNGSIGPVHDPDTELVAQEV